MKNFTENQIRNIKRTFYTFFYNSKIEKIQSISEKEVVLVDAYNNTKVFNISKVIGLFRKIKFNHTQEEINKSLLSAISYCEERIQLAEKHNDRIQNNEYKSKNYKTLTKRRAKKEIKYFSDLINDIKTCI